MNNQLNDREEITKSQVGLENVDSRPQKPKYNPLGILAVLWFLFLLVPIGMTIWVGFVRANLEEAYIWIALTVSWFAGGFVCLRSLKKGEH